MCQYFFTYVSIVFHITWSCRWCCLYAAGWETESW